MRYLWCLCLVLVAAAAVAQDYPNHPIKIYVPAAPGGTTDLLARLFGAKLGELVKQQVIVENRASASGVAQDRGRANCPRRQRCIAAS